MRYLDPISLDQKKDILNLYFSTIAPKIVGMKNNSDIVIRVFEYYATFWSSYNRLRQDFQLPTLRTLRRITLKVSKHNERSFFTNCI